MVILPRVRCPGCGKFMAEVKAKEVPPAIKLDDCLRRCKKCNIGATNAKNPAKVKFIFPPPKAGNNDVPPPAGGEQGGAQ